MTYPNPVPTVGIVLLGGGIPIVTDDLFQTYVATTRYGAGRVVVFGSERMVRQGPSLVFYKKRMSWVRLQFM